MQKLILISLLLLFTSLVASEDKIEISTQKKEVRVGAFNYYPGIFQDSDGKVKGFFVDMLNEMAKRENWDIKYVYGTWNEGLERIKNHEVDILTSVAYTKERSQFLDYPQNHLFTVWSQVYVNENSDVTDLLDIQDKKVALMKGDFNAQAFFHLINSFHINCEIIELDNFDQIFEAIANGKADCGVVNNTYGSNKYNQYSLKPTDIIFNPFDIYFAVAKNRNKDLLNRIDFYLSEWKKDSSSPFFKALEDWSHQKINVISKLPGWFYGTILALALLIVGSLLFNFLLKKKITQTTEQIKESEERYQLAMNATNDGLFDWNVQTNELYLSPAWKKMLGYKEEEIEHYFSTWERLTHKDDVEKTIKIVESHFSGEAKKYEAEFRMKHKDGHWVNILARGNAIFDKNGNPIRLVGTHIDVTSRRKYELALLESERRLSTLMSNLPGMAYRCLNDENWTMEFISNGCVSLTGYSGDDLIGNKNISFNDLILEEDQERIWNEVQNALELHKQFYLEYRIMTKNKTIKHVMERGVGVYEGEELLFLEGFISDVTERVEAEIELRKLHEMLARTQNIAKVGGWEFDVVNNKVIWTEEVANIHEVDKDTNIELDMAISFYHGESTGKIKKAVEDAVKNAKPYDLELEIITAKGNKKHVRTIGIPVKQNGKVVKIEGSFQDISEKKKLELQISLINKALENSLNGFDIVDKNGRLIYVNKAYVKMWGFDSAEEIIGTSPADHCAEPGIPEKIISSLKKDGHCILEFKGKRKDGSLFDVLMYALLDHDHDGNEIYTGTSLDISERKQNELQLKEKNEFIQAILDNLPIGLALNYINNGETFYINKKFEEIYGWPSEELKYISDFFPRVFPDEEYRNEVMKMILEDINSGDEKRMHWENLNIVTKKGEKRIVNGYNIPLFEQNTMVSTVIDVTAQRKAERALIESQRLGAIGEMSSSIAHDFNNSLQVIIGNLELILIKSETPDSLQKYLNAIKMAATDSAARVDLIQRFSGKKQSLSNYHEVNLNKIIDDVIVQSRPLWKDNAEKSGLVINVVKNCGNIPEIKGNESELRTVLYNMIKNSVEAMPKGGTLKIETGERGNFVFLNLSDTGIGMDEETKARLFQPFYTTKGFEAGRGLGMSGSYTIINEHDAEIKVVETTLGKGTTIEIIFPKTKFIETQKPKNQEFQYTGSANILWVDDDEMIREVAKEMLENLGHNGNIANSGEEALKLLETKKYDFVVMDIGMPGMSGWQLVKKIKEKYGDDIKMALLSGWGSEIDIEEQKKSGITHVLSKPFKISSLEKLISDMMLTEKK